MDKLDELAALEAADEQPGDTEPAEDVQPETDEQPLIVGKYRSMEDAVQAFEHAQSMIGRQAEENRRIREELDQLRAQQHQPAQYQQQSEVDQLMSITPQMLDQLIDNGEMTTANAMMILQAQAEVRSQEALEERLAQIEQKLAPIEQRTGETQAERLWNSLKLDYGDELVHRHRDMLRERVERDPSYLAVDTKTAAERLGDAIAAAEWRASRTQAQPKPRDPQTGRFVQEGAVHVEGGSTPPPQQTTSDEDVDPEIAEIRAAKPRTDIFGVIPGEGGRS